MCDTPSYLYPLYTLYTPILPYVYLCTHPLYTCICTIYTPNTPLNTPLHTPYTLYIRFKYALKQPITQVHDDGEGLEGRAPLHRHARDVEELSGPGLLRIPDDEMGYFGRRHRCALDRIDEYRYGR